MEEKQRPRGRLSRRRPPAGDGPPSHRPRFLLDQRESEPWAILLHSTVSLNSDLTLGSQPLPPLPAFPSQKPLPGLELTVPPEVFMVGPKTFSWTPLPPAPGSSCSSYQPGAGGPLGPPTASPKDQFTSDPRETPRIQECLSVQSSPALQSCPMCQKEFAPTLVQLDVDSHLAQCLAESTEDMEW